METLKLPTRKPRLFIADDFSLINWESVRPFYERLLEQEINSVKELEAWFINRSELESFLSEDMAWRYIKMTSNTASEDYQKKYQFFISEIQPNLAVFDDRLNKKVLDCPYTDQLEDKRYNISLRALKKAVEIFREENIPLFTEVQLKQTEYQAISAAMTVTIDGEEMTLQKAGLFLKAIDRKTRQATWESIGKRRSLDIEKLNLLFNELKALRHKIGVNAGFENFRDYMFAALGRFDYSPQDCLDFHDSIAEAVVPLLSQGAKERKETLSLSQLKPWDNQVDLFGRPALIPFQGGEDLLNKTEACFDLIDKKLGNYIRVMRKMGHFDVESRKGKAPGGYNYPLEEIGVPFIFMNATSSLRDVVTMVHEGGHAIHSFETRDLHLNSFRSTTAEVAEVASMAMELISMEHWGVFFKNKEELNRAKIEHLEGILTVLPWIATIDKFQHWIYENPEHSTEKRNASWLTIFDQFSDDVTDWSGYKAYKTSNWQRQLHIFEVPFYYIEYGIAQLGAISVWRNYKKDRVAGLDAYIKGLRLGYTVPIGEIYEAMNIKFDFSKEYIADLMSFVNQELKALKSPD